MSVLYVALPVAIAMGATALWLCVRCILSGQFDDLETPPVRMLIDDDPRSVTAKPPHPPGEVGRSVQEEV